MRIDTYVSKVSTVVFLNRYDLKLPTQGISIFDRFAAVVCVTVLVWLYIYIRKLKSRSSFCLFDTWLARDFVKISCYISLTFCLSIFLAV